MYPKYGQFLIECGQNKPKNVPTYAKMWSISPISVQISYLLLGQLPLLVQLQQRVQVIEQHRVLALHRLHVLQPAQVLVKLLTHLGE